MQALHYHRRRQLTLEHLEHRRVLAAVIPNDPLFPQQWNWHNLAGHKTGPADIDMDIPEAWSVTTGSMSTVVAVLDNGVDYRHEDLYQNIWINQGEIPNELADVLVDSDEDGSITFRDLNDVANEAFVSDLNESTYIDAGDILADPRWEDGEDTDGNGYVDDLVGWDWVDGDNDPMAVNNSHGTGQAGRIGAMGDNGIGMAGLNWDVQMMPLRFDGRMPNDRWTVEAAVAAIDYAVEMGAPISNNSWSGAGCSVESCNFGDFSPAIYDAIERARLAGHLFVAGVGNSAADLDQEPRAWTEYDLENILLVTGTDENDQLYGHPWGRESIDVAAPTKDSTGTGLNNSYLWASSGVSASVSLVSGVAALVRSVHPDWDASQIKAQILSTVDQTPSFEGIVSAGGRVNAAAAVGAEQGNDPVQPPATTFLGHDIISNSQTFSSTYSADLDGDDDLDVLVTSHPERTISWYRNTGTGAFGENVLVAEGVDIVHAADLDGDGDVDVLSLAKDEHTVAWYENDGKGDFSPPQVLTTKGRAHSALSAADIDGDGDVDVLTAARDEILWYENTDGAGAFQPRQVITNPFTFFSSVVAADVDGDGDLDVLSAAISNNRLYWHENIDGAGDFGRPKTISRTVDRPSSVFAADIDGDGDIDALSASTGDDKIAWYPNDGQGEFGDQLIITTLADGVPQHVNSRVSVADADGDGDLDVFSSSFVEGKVAWYENLDSRGTFSLQRVVSTDTRWIDMHLADVDADGDVDVLSGGQGQLTWFENQLSGDADDDGKVDFADFLRLSATFGNSEARWEDGDFNGNGVVDFADFLILSQNFGKFRTGE